MNTAIVVGAGPNGLAAAITLARHGVEVTVLEATDTIGGGARSSERILPGLRHDDCAAVHPIGFASPFFRGLDLAAHGLEWAWPDIDLAHPLDGGRAGVMMSSLHETGRMMGVDGGRWRTLFGPLSARFDELAQDVLRPMLHRPRHPALLAMFGSAALLPATVLGRIWRTDEAAAVFAGNAAHGWHPLTRPATSAFAVMFAAISHRYGWPVAKGGSSRLAEALAGTLEALGGCIETGHRVRSLAELPATDLVMLDLEPGAVVELAGDALPAPVRRSYRRFRRAPAAFRVDFAVEGGIPWRDEFSGRAGTVHVCGSAAEVAVAEHEIHAGRMPERPFVLVGQQYLADPQRSVGDVHPVYTYAHVPHGYTGDATDAIVAQLERFAPGTRERILGYATRSPHELQEHNSNLVGGDIIGGANTPLQVVMRPRISLDPYFTGIPGVYMCSASTPPGAGVHGMCGHNAALSALRSARGVS
ncbi:phytoene desaturase family protein [Nocardia farcinica]|uniref:phytoene desaturase family protein n=1 Tax=Nocardia farcinica TaxID=37329 RepID=UPI0018956869|nr:NAD(P)/FAD-dependent oxidoreductase [Nocardia farcinica]MBF6266327.1 NAD(P)/FAD-dependent oxidoreductase [Nocardia farcinica]MCZ9325348.1 NAD(P)/FAD-dependent oxidoreductase [Nocardia farcinica]